MDISSLFRLTSLQSAAPLIFALILAIILIVSFRSRAVVFCQYLKRMTGIHLQPSEVRRVFKEQGRDGVRAMFLDLIIREDLKDGPLQLPSNAPAIGDEERPLQTAVNEQPVAS